MDIQLMIAARKVVRLRRQVSIRYGLYVVGLEACIRCVLIGL